MKKFCAAMLLCAALAGSAGAEVIVAIFPVYDWVRELSKGAGLEVALLLDKGVDLHSYQPTVQDLARVAACDAFVYVGGESDEWVHDALKNTINTKQVRVNLLELLGEAVKPEEIVEGMEHEHHDHDHDHEHAHSEPDEHVWLSLRNAAKICSHLAFMLSELDPKHKDIYSANLADYLQKLSDLDRQYQAVVKSAKRNVLLFADRFPFRYLADDYGIKYFAAFSGCSAETEASFETVKFLTEKVSELNLLCVIIIDGTTHKLAQTITASTHAKILTLNSMQAAQSPSASYLSIMAGNLAVLKAALN